jgi:Protein of unknown function (DUF2961)
MQVHTLLDGVKGQGHYAGTYLTWGVHNNGWWGEDSDTNGTIRLIGLYRQRSGSNRREQPREQLTLVIRLVHGSATRRCTSSLPPSTPPCTARLPV